MDKVSKLKISVLLGIMCFFLTAGIVIQINTVRKSTTTVGKTMVENELRDSVLRWKQRYESAYDSLNKKESELDSLRQQVSTTDGSHASLTNQLKEYNSLLGNTELIGRGIEITLKDGDASVLRGFESNYIVHDGDLYEIVNALKNAGADAISINNQRIVSNTSINCVGNTIMINDEKIGPPYVIRAIGSPAGLYGSLTMAGGYLYWLEYEGVNVKVNQVDKDTIVIPKYNGIYKFNYATIPEE